LAKQRIQFLCNHCGGVQAKWMGKCPDCGTWDSLEEYKTPTPDGRAVVRQPHTGDLTTGGEAVVVSDIDEQDIPRIPTGNGEFDRILGGGIVPGSVVLVGGEPGIGKSTLMLQVANALAARDEKKGKNPKPEAPILYVTSEESARQTKLRASRLGVASSTLLVLAETNLERIVNQINKIQPAVVVIDSIQMIYKPDLPAAPGSVTQLRDGCMELVYLAKASGIAMLLVGHVTKAGTLAGPKIVEHIVDTVIYFEGDRFHSHRIVRCVKNRFGSTHEVGLFEMTGQGLREVSDPGNLFVEQYGPGGPPSGSIITAAMQGTRVLLVEVQGGQTQNQRRQRRPRGDDHRRIGKTGRPAAGGRRCLHQHHRRRAHHRAGHRPGDRTGHRLRSFQPTHGRRHVGNRRTGAGGRNPTRPPTGTTPSRSLAAGPWPRHRPPHGREHP
jgi:DNA repair protein RadA/Sms